MTANVIQWGKVSGRGHPHPTIAKCLHCGKEYRTFPSYLKRRPGGGYCSPRCSGAAGASGHQHPRTTTTCATCGKVFPRFPAHTKQSAHNYCSRDCYVQAITFYPSRPCVICGKVFKPKGVSRQTLATGHGTGAHCSRACYGVSITRRAQERRATTADGGVSIEQKGLGASRAT